MDDNAPYEFAIGEIITFSLRDYRIEILNRACGGFGAVYTARNLDTEELVCVKTPRRDLYNTSGVYEAFAYEAELWISLPMADYILPAYSILSSNGKPFLVMKYIPPFMGHPPALDKLIPIFTADTPSVCSSIISIAYALHYITEAQPGFVHGDIKPGNVFMQVDERNPDKHNIILSDFGLSNVKKLGPNPISGGDYNYIAPEMLKGELSSPISDAYSLGCFFFELITKQKYQQWDPTTKEIVKVNIREKEFRSRHPEMPKALVKTVFSCLSTNPRQRPRSYTELFQVLKAALAKSGMEFVFGNQTVAEARAQGKFRGETGEVAQETEIYAHYVRKGIDGAIVEKVLTDLTRASHLRAVGNFSGSEDLLRKAELLMPDYTPIFHGLAHGKLLQGEFPEAVDLYFQFLTSDETTLLRSLDSEFDLEYGGACVSIAQAIGGILAQSGGKLSREKIAQLHAAGLHYAREGRDIFPDNPRSHLSLGILSVISSEYAEAHTHFKHALELDPNNLAAKRNLEQLEQII